MFHFVRTFDDLIELGWRVLTSRDHPIARSPDSYQACCAAGGLPCCGLGGAACFLPSTFFGGARIACSVFPSIRGRNSTTARSPTSFNRRSSTWRPKLVWVISRPRKKMVAFTLSPCSRKRSTWFFL